MGSAECPRNRMGRPANPERFDPRRRRQSRAIWLREKRPRYATELALTKRGAGPRSACQDDASRDEPKAPPDSPSSRAREWRFPGALHVRRLPSKTGKSSSRRSGRCVSSRPAYHQEV